MRSRLRQYLLPVLALFGLVMLAVGAAAAPELLDLGQNAGSQDERDSREAEKEARKESKEKSADEGEADAETAGGPNHGQCVSKWAHEAKEQGLEGKLKGQFVASIAKDVSNVGSDCDMQAQLSAALGEQAQQAADEQEAPPPGKARGKGHSGKANRSGRPGH